MKIVFVAYNYHPHIHSPAEWIEKIQPLAGIMQALAHHAEVCYAGRIGYTGNHLHEGVQYIFPDTKKDSRFFPRRFHKAIAETNADACIVLGFHFPVQLIQLNKKMGRDCIILVRHHADVPARSFKRIVQRQADKYTDGYLFNSVGNADEWLQSGIISDASKIIELPAGSTSMTRPNLAKSLGITGMDGSPNFVWVGRLDENKDPLTVLRAFEKLVVQNPAAKLYMIYQQDQLIIPVKQMIDASAALKRSVSLVGKVDYNELSYWYSAADYYIQSSHREGGSYALLEAMACGCVPIVTDIPASVKAIGDTGFVFEPGNVDALVSVLSNLDIQKWDEQSARVQQYFQNEFSPAAIAQKLHCIIQHLG